MKLPPGHVGAASELRVAADLIEKGFEVFRNVSANGPVDLVAVKDKQTWKIQVKTKVKPHPQPEWDVAAVVHPNRVDYFSNKAFPFVTATFESQCEYFGNSDLYDRCGNYKMRGSMFCSKHHLKKVTEDARSQDHL